MQCVNGLFIKTALLITRDKLILKKVKYIPTFSLFLYNNYTFHVKSYTIMLIL